MLAGFVSVPVLGVPFVPSVTGSNTLEAAASPTVPLLEDPSFDPVVPGFTEFHCMLCLWP